MITEKGKEWIKEHGGDGHSIYHVESVPFADLGLNEADRKRLTRSYKSDTSSPTSTIFKDGKIMPEVKGVYLLSLWYAIAGQLGVDDAGRMFNGRGSQARALCQAINAKLN